MVSGKPPNHHMKPADADTMEVYSTHQEIAATAQCLGAADLATADHMDFE